MKTSVGHNVMLHIPSTELDSTILTKLSLHFQKDMRFTPAGRWTVNSRLYIQSPQHQQLMQEQQQLFHAHHRNNNSDTETPKIPVQLQSRQLYVVVADHLPKLYSIVTFAEIDRMDQVVPVEGNKELGNIIAKLKNLWTSRQSAVIEGTEFVKMDTIIRFGLVNVGASTRGIVIYLQVAAKQDSNASETPPQPYSDVSFLLKEIYNCVASVKSNLISTIHTSSFSTNDNDALLSPALQEIRLIVQVLRLQSIL
ncbi:hypothetical protein QVD99_000394 [Batrachochytrium dendrobatidis]|nr:hypothetical protein QVD99_000394 [Batrachochytrium dendrobatidis]